MKKKNTTRQFHFIPHFFTQLFSCVLTIIHNASSKAVKWSYVVCSEEHELDSRRLKTALGEFDENAAK